MSRRSKPEKRDIIPDVRYNSIQVQTFHQQCDANGKKSVAARLVYDALDLVEERTKKMVWKYSNRQLRMSLR